MGIYIEHQNKQEWCIAHGTPYPLLERATREETVSAFHHAINNRKMIVCLIDKYVYKAVLICWYPKELWRAVCDSEEVLGFYGIPFDEVDKLTATTCDDMIAEARELGYVT